MSNLNICRAQSNCVQSVSAKFEITVEKKSKPQLKKRVFYKKVENNEVYVWKNCVQGHEKMKDYCLSMLNCVQVFGSKNKR